MHIPASNSSGDTGSRVRAGSREADIADDSTSVDGSRQTPEGNVVVGGAGVVAGVDQDLSDSDLGAAGSPLLLALVSHSFSPEGVERDHHRFIGVKRTRDPARTRTDEAETPVEQWAAVTTV